MMKDREKMVEQFDVYADAFLVTVTPFGANLSFELRQAHPSPVSAQTTERLGTVRMSVEHLKIMVMMIKKQVYSVEEQTGVRFDVPTSVLSQLHIAREDWDHFWRNGEGS